MGWEVPEIQEIRDCNGHATGFVSFFARNPFYL
jgi:hypothetical protein